MRTLPRLAIAVAATIPRPIPGSARRVSITTQSSRCKADIPPQPALAAIPPMILPSSTGVARPSAAPASVISAKTPSIKAAGVPTAVAPAATRRAMTAGRFPNFTIRYRPLPKRRMPLREVASDRPDFTLATLHQDTPQTPGQAAVAVASYRRRIGGLERGGQRLGRGRAGLARTALGRA